MGYSPVKPEDKEQFAQTLKSACEVHNRNYTQDLAGIWWNMMQSYSLDEFQGAVFRHLRKEKFFPKPSEIIALLDGNWIGPDEAWAVFPKDEQESAAINQAMAAAWDAASDIYHEGDTIGARMAFKAAYDRYVSGAIGRGERELWSVSLGWDGDNREPAIRSALDRNLITHETACKLLDSVPVKDGGPIAGLLTGKTEGQGLTNDEVREQLKKVKEMLLH